MTEQGINPRELGILFLEKFPIILLTTVISTAIAWNDAQDIQPRYRASATIQVDYEQASVVDIQAVDTQDLSEYDVLNTIVETVSNLELMRQVIRDHDLLNNETFAGKNAGSASLDRLARSLKGLVSCSLREETRLIDLSVTHRDRDLAQDLVNYIAKGYVKQHANRALSINKQANQRLNNEAEQLKSKLRSAESALIDFRRNSNMVVKLEERQGLIEARIEQLNQSLDQLDEELSRLTTDIGMIDAFGPEPSTLQLRQVPSIAESEVITDHYEKLLAQRAVVSALQHRYGEKHPKRYSQEQALAQMEQAFKDVVEEMPVILKATYERQSLQRANIMQRVSKAEAESLNLSYSAVEYNVLQREVTTTTDLYRGIVERIKEIDVTTGLQDQVISVVEESDRAYNVAKDGTSTILLGFCFGIAIGMGIVYVLHLLDSSLKSVDQAEQALQIPALGAIPCSEPKNRLAKSRLIMMSAPSSTCAEAFRSLRANIESLGSSEKKITLFTSSAPAEGKTFACINYALTLVQQGLKTIVIDLDLRHPSVGGDFSFGGEKLNVADLLEDPRTLGEFAEEKLENPTHNLYVLPVGGQLDSPAERLASQPVIDLIRKAAATFDRVVIDSAPLNPVGDTLSIVQLVDVICMVVRCRKTPVRVIQRSLEVLRRFNSPASGVVLNFVPAKKSMGNYYYYYGGSKSPYEGSQHYPSQSLSPARETRESSSSGPPSDAQNQPAPRHRRRRPRHLETPEMKDSSLKPGLESWESDSTSVPSQSGDELSTPTSVRRRRRIRRPDPLPEMEESSYLDSTPHQ